MFIYFYRRLLSLAALLLSSFHYHLTFYFLPYELKRVFSVSVLINLVLFFFRRIVSSGANHVNMRLVLLKVLGHPPEYAIPRKYVSYTIQTLRTCSFCLCKSFYGHKLRRALAFLQSTESKKILGDRSNRTG